MTGQLLFEATEEVHPAPSRVHAYYRAPAQKYSVPSRRVKVHFTPEGGHTQRTNRCLLCAIRDQRIAANSVSI